jgi:hypothetical protein
MKLPFILIGLADLSSEIVMQVPEVIRVAALARLLL